jgi:hypothetical protein
MALQPETKEERLWHILLVAGGIIVFWTLILLLQQ